MKTDRSLLFRLHRRDHDAFRQLFETYFKRLYDFAASLVFDADLAEDIVQAVFLKLYEEPHKLGNQTNIGGWLFVSTRNACFRYLREQRVQDRKKLLYLQAVERADVLDLADEEEIAAILRQIFDSLPEKCREICEMRFFGNMKFSEIAQQLSISENTARVQVFRALEKMRQNAWPDSMLGAVLTMLITSL